MRRAVGNVTPVGIVNAEFENQHGTPRILNSGCAMFYTPSPRFASPLSHFCGTGKGGLFLRLQRVSGFLALSRCPGMLCTPTARSAGSDFLPKIYIFIKIWGVAFLFNAGNLG